MTTPLKSGGTFETFRDVDGNLLSSINRDGTISVQGVDFADGSSMGTAVQTLNVTVTPTQFKALGSSPLVLVPGVAGKAISIVSAFLAYSFQYGGTAYIDPSGTGSVAIASGNDFTALVNAGGFWIIPFAGFFDFTSSYMQAVPPVDTAGTFPTLIVGAPLVLFSYDGSNQPVDFTTGNTPIKISLQYVEVDQ
jgi:hypothetical protein